MLPPTVEEPERSDAAFRKRTFDQAGLITPRETPRKPDLSKDGKSYIDRTAKVLFPTTKRRKFQVFQDPRSPDPFLDDVKNPFAGAQKAVPERFTDEAPTSRLPSSLEVSDTHAVQTVADHDLPTTTKNNSGERRSPSPRRKDGMTYVFRGRKVFRKYSSPDAAEVAEAVRPKRLFVKEMSTPKLSNPFCTDEFEDEEDLDPLELPLHKDTAPSIEKDTPR